MKKPSKRQLRRVAVIGVSAGIVVATFVYFLPTIANYGEVWGVVKDLSWPWIAALLGATAINLVTFAPPWQVALGVGDDAARAALAQPLDCLRQRPRQRPRRGLEKDPAAGPAERDRSQLLLGELAQLGFGDLAAGPHVRGQAAPAELAPPKTSAS